MHGHYRSGTSWRRNYDVGGTPPAAVPYDTVANRVVFFLYLMAVTMQRHTQWVLDQWELTINIQVVIKNGT